MFRTWAEALSRLDADDARVGQIQRQLERAYRKGREDMARDLRNLLGAKGECDD